MMSRRRKRPSLKEDHGEVREFEGMRIEGSTFWPKDRKLHEMVFSVVGPTLKSGDRVLEMGTGSGIITKRLAEGAPKGVSFTATDLNEDAAKTARGNLSHLDNVSVKSGDMFDPVGDETFDAIIWNPPWYGERRKGKADDIAHVDPGHKELKRFVDGAFKRLNPGGMVFVAIPRDESQALWDMAEDMGKKIEESASYKTKKHTVALYELK